ncbi:MAG: 3'(2'),5'-bisphosphate nucleotidase CysQ [Pseudomonadota bacterium]
MASDLGTEKDRIETELRDLALKAGQAIMAVYAQPDFETKAKSDASPVTEADLAADKIISEGLAAAFPDIPAVTEEQAESHAQQGLERFFLVDPLDGTKEFVQRRGDFTVNIALIEQGRPIIGVVYAPAKGRLFRTLGQGAVQEQVDETCAPVPGSESPIKVSSPDNAALVVVASKSHRDQATDDFIGKFQVADFKAAGSSLKFCLVAGGEADFYPRLGRTMEWDTAAGHAVLLAAGGQVLRFDDKSDLTYGKSGFENPFFLAVAAGVRL